MPDAQTFLLPARVYLLSMRDQNLPLRRAALDDALTAYRDAPRTSDHQRQIVRIALVALVGETLQILEDLAAFADSFYTAPKGTAFFAALTNYNVHRANNFYAQMKKRLPEYFLDLLGLRRGTLRLEDAFVVDPPFTPAELAAIDEAHQATAKLVAKHLINLADDWRKYRPFANAYKHGLLVANPEDVTLLDDAGTEVEGIVVWQRRRSGAEGYGHIPPPFDAMADYLAAAANVARDVLEHLVDSRLRMFELIDLRADGSWTPRPLKTTPWQRWFDKTVVSESSRALLSARFNMTFELEELVPRPAVELSRSPRWDLSRSSTNLRSRRVGGSENPGADCTVGGRVGITC